MLQDSLWASKFYETRTVQLEVRGLIEGLEVLTVIKVGLLGPAAMPFQSNIAVLPLTALLRALAQRFWTGPLNAISLPVF